MFSMDSMTTAGRTTRRAIRIWDREGLLGDVARDDRGNRVFTAQQVERAGAIAAGQMAGMSLPEIRSASLPGIISKAEEARDFLDDWLAGRCGGFDL